MSERKTSSAAADPIFAAIEDQRRAWRAVIKAMDAERTEANKAAEETLAQEEITIRARLVGMSPSTTAGTRALLLWSVEWYDHEDAQAALIRRIARSPVLSEAIPDAAEVAAFDALYRNWKAANFTGSDPNDDSDEAYQRMMDTLYAAEEALVGTPTPTPAQLKHKFHYLDYSVEHGNDGDIAGAVASIKADLRRWGFDLPDAPPPIPTSRHAEEGAAA